MGVNSLWKVLDEAGCGKPVGIQEMTDPEGLSREAALRGVNPWNARQRHKAQQVKRKKKVVLAVDLSIWICESLSSVIAENHTHPAIHLVFSRTVKLLSMGIGLVFVIEGKRRVRDAGITHNDEADKFRKRRNGTAFWKACRNCHDMLKLLGVTVVRAKAEGEALCALLNQLGIVDGVISSDGDCLLFGAKVVYTKFSIENLENNRVVRYDAERLAAVVKATDDKDVSRQEVGRCSLGRQDLIAFALLTGSDLAGGGLDKVGRKKAIRFIRKCKLDNPMRIETAAIDELKSWARSIAPCDRDPFDEEPVIPVKAPGRWCSRCNHAGTKTCHLKNGCEVCGTEPGEPCYECTSDDRFRLGLRAKALAIFPKFDPSQVVEAYTRPNENQIPIQFASQPIPRMNTPDLAGLMKMKLIVKGRSTEASREHIKNAIGRLLSRAELLQEEPDASTGKENNPVRMPRDKPVPLEITKSATVAGVASYHVSWRACATLTDDDGNGIDGYEYSTVEPQELMQKRFPNIVKKYQQAEKERLKQGDGEKNRRRAFLASLRIDVAAPVDGEKPAESDPSPRKRRDKRRQGFFGGNEKRQQPKLTKSTHGGDDVCQLLRFMKNRPNADFDSSSIESTAQESLDTCNDDSERAGRSHETPTKQPDIEQPDTPISPLYCHFGSFLIPVTPIDAVRSDEYPPRRIYIRLSQER